jgi:predicted DNA-binding transcriptional regulator AlpA
MKTSNVEAMTRANAAAVAAMPAHEPPASVPPLDRLLYKMEVVERVGVTYVTLWKWMGAGKFPQRRLVGRRIAWLESEIAVWISNRPVRGVADPEANVPSFRGRAK